MENGGSQNGIGTSLRDAFGQMVQRANPAGSDDRNLDGIGHRPCQRQIKAILGAIPIHAGEQDFAGAQCLDFFCPLDDILPGIVAGYLMAFTLSIDDFVITFFVAGVGMSTLPLQIYSMIKVAVTPEINAISTLLMCLTLTLIGLASRFAPEALRGKS